MIIEVFGKGCHRCHATRDNAIKALKELNLKEGEDAAVNHITDLTLFAGRGVLLTPTVIIDGVKMSEGRVPETPEIKQWIEERK
jgi:small redox-active disulfide protein 2